MRNSAEKYFHHSLIDACEKAGINITVEDDGRIIIVLKTPSGNYHLSNEFERETKRILRRGEGNFAGAHMSDKPIEMINFDKIRTPLALITVVLHEMGHTATMKPDYGQREAEAINLINDIIIDYNSSGEWDVVDPRYIEAVSRLAKLTEQSEREAWEWTIKKLLFLKKEYGWDFRTLDTLDVLKRYITPFLEIYLKNAIALALAETGDMLGEDSNFSEQDKGRLISAISQHYNLAAMNSLIESKLGSI